MTLEETLTKIKAQADEEYEVFEKTGSMICRGFALGAYDALAALEKVEPAEKDKMTLTELARELRKLFKFKYLTAHRSGVELFLRMYAKEPSYFKTYSVWGEADAVFFPIAVSEDLRVDIDLSEYKDADGNIDYSKCIVEVE